MAKRKSDNRGKSRRRPWWVGLLRFMVRPPVGYLVLAVIIVALAYWQWANLVSWASDVRDSTLRLFGWGLVFIAIAVVTLVWVVWRRKLSSFIYHGNR